MFFTVTYEIITPESAEDGDAAERGVISRNVPLREALADLAGTRTSRVDGVNAIEFSGHPVSRGDWLTVYNGMGYETGAYESRSLHFPKNITLSTMRRIARLCGA